MLKRLTILSSLLLLSVSLGGCSKCGWIWNDWQSTPQSCRSDAPPR
jgi:hypothetical protein